MRLIRHIRPVRHMGFSLVEVLVALSILVVFLVAAMTVTTYFLKTTKSAEYKILASHYGEEGAEWTGTEKEADWSVFINRDFSAGGGTTYCLNTLDWSNANSCGGYALGSPAFFKRELLIQKIGSPVSQVNAIITVSWIESNGIKSVVIKNVYTIAE